MARPLLPIRSQKRVEFLEAAEAAAMVTAVRWMAAATKPERVRMVAATRVWGPLWRDRAAGARR